MTTSKVIGRVSGHVYWNEEDMWTAPPEPPQTKLARKAGIGNGIKVTFCHPVDPFELECEVTLQDTDESCFELLIAERFIPHDGFWLKLIKEVVVDRGDKKQTLRASLTILDQTLFDTGVEDGDRIQIWEPFEL